MAIKTMFNVTLNASRLSDPHFEIRDEIVGLEHGEDEFCGDALFALSVTLNIVLVAILMPF